MKSAFRMDDMDIELSLPNEDDEEEMKPENVSSLRGDQIYCLQKQPGAAPSLPMLVVETTSRELTMYGV